MNTNTTTADSAADQQIYNHIMMDIEPDLTTDMIPFLDEMYAWQTPEEKEERLEWYREALDMCMDRLKLYVSVWGKQIDNVKKVVKEYVQGSEKNQNKTDLNAIEGSLDSE